MSRGGVPYFSHDVCNICDGFQFYFSFLIYSLYEECDKAETKLGYFDRSRGLHIACMETSDA